MVAAILSGGRNSRYPSLKGFIELGGMGIIERTMMMLRGLGHEVVISTNEPEHYFTLGVPLIGDTVPSAGPMSGIVSVMDATGADELFVIACDMPFVRAEVISYIIGQRAKEATVPLLGGRPEPLLAVYTKDATQRMRQMIGEGNTSIAKMLQEMDVRYISEEELKAIDPSGESFMNINTPEDYDRAVKHMGSKAMSS